MLRIISRCWGYYHREFTGNVVRQTQGGKLIRGLGLLIKQLGLQNNRNAQGLVCRCLDMRNNMRVRIYVLAECVSGHVGKWSIWCSIIWIVGLFISFHSYSIMSLVDFWFLPSISQCEKKHRRGREKGTEGFKGMSINRLTKTIAFNYTAIPAVF